MKKYKYKLTPEQREKHKNSKWLKLVEGVPYSEGKKGEVKIFKTSSRKTETTKNQLKKQLPLENIESISWIDGKVNILYKDGTKLTSNANEIEFVSGYKNENDIPLNDHCL